MHIVTQASQLTPGYSIKTVYRKDAIHTYSFFLKYFVSAHPGLSILEEALSYMVGTYIVIIQWKQRLQNNKARLFRVFLLCINTCIIRTYSDNYNCKCYTTWVYNNKKNIHDHICVREIINEHIYNMYENTGISVLQEMSLICMQD